MESLVEKMNLLDIYRGKKVLVTGHTGFKGSWLSIWLCELGADVVGFSLEKSDNDFVFRNSGLKNHISDERGDINDLNSLKRVFDKFKPEIVFHLAAQPLVRRSYKEPSETLNTNIIGTAHVLECIKSSDSVKAGVLITTDKCYKNKEQAEGYKETDELGGHDPYSTSKACAELVIESYRKSFLSHADKLVASARAGNAIGGGDYAEDRLIPDCIRALKKGEIINIRNPSAVRPWQHVLEPLYGYLLLGRKLLEGKEVFAKAWNFAPDSDSAISVKETAELLIELWGKGEWVHSNNDKKMHETKLLNLDATMAKKELGWCPRWDIRKAIEKTMEWYKESEGNNAYNLCAMQIKDYFA
jgi:CDP-glucose 4,6-dehydratase